jgi:4-hydroxybenzoyl-CoA thioesterase
VSVYERPVSFEDVDAAGIVFFARYFGYCHEAMERFFDAIPGGYVDLITKRKIGFPTVHLETDFTAPLRYGDVARITVAVVKVGTSSCTFRYDLKRVSDGASVAGVTQVVVSTSLETMTKVPLPADCRAALEGG